MFKSWLKRTTASVLHVAKQVCLVAGIGLVVLSTSWILVPFALGVTLLAVAKWAADREAEQAPMVVVPAGA
jgi:hypothetical protein